VLVDQDRANLGVARAQLEKDQANLVYAKVTYERNRRLSALDSTSRDALDSSKNLADQAQALVDLDQSTIDLRQAALNAAQINLDYTDIKSPVDGTVVTRNVEMGQTVAASFQTPTLFLIATDLTQMQVDTNVSESDIGAMKVGTKASFTVEAYGNREFAGEVTQVRQAPQTIQNVVTYDAVVSVPNAGLALMPGMTATVHLITDRRDNVLRMPDQALRYVPGGLAGVPGATPEAGTARVYVLRDGKPVAIDIATGLDDDTETEIVKGALQAGDAVVVGEHLTAPARRPAGPRAPRL
jgi:HlyD family secretion protein